MANVDEKSNDFYAVLGLDKECTQTELRNSYKKLAMKWHPDLFTNSRYSKFVEEANKKFQVIQQAYSVFSISIDSVLSDTNKRFLYDVGAYDSDDDGDDGDGMSDFLDEMTAMMGETKSSDTGGESLEELQELFEKMFDDDRYSFGSRSRSIASRSMSSFASCSEASNPINKHGKNF